MLYKDAEVHRNYKENALYVEDEGKLRKIYIFWVYEFFEENQEKPYKTTVGKTKKTEARDVLHNCTSRLFSLERRKNRNLHKVHANLHYEFLEEV